MYIGDHETIRAAHAALARTHGTKRVAVAIDKILGEYGYVSVGVVPKHMLSSFYKRVVAALSGPRAG